MKYLERIMDGSVGFGELFSLFFNMVWFGADSTRNQSGTTSRSLCNELWSSILSGRAYNGTKLSYSLVEFSDYFIVDGEKPRSMLSNV